MGTEFWKWAHSYLDSASSWIAAYAVVLSMIQAVLATKKLRHYWSTRHLQRVWGIKNGDQVIVVCSELDDPKVRQQVEPREFIYSCKYGDLDAYIEVLVTLLRLYPAVRMRIVSTGEAENTPLDLARHLVVIGGPDYNPLAKRILSRSKTQYDYRSPYVDVQSTSYPEKIVLYDKVRDQEHCNTTDERDFGYFERIPNPHNPKSRIILIGGCHTIGVAGAVKAFSVLVEVERSGQTISVPRVQPRWITAGGLHPDKAITLE